MYAKVVVPEDEDESENSDVTSVNVFMKKNNDVRVIKINTA